MEKWVRRIRETVDVFFDCDGYFLLEKLYSDGIDICDLMEYTTRLYADMKLAKAAANKIALIHEHVKAFARES